MSNALRNEYHDEETSKRLAQMHENRTSSPETVAAIVREGISKDIVDYDRIVRGEVNEVLAVRLEDADDVILRIARRKTNKFEAEAWAMEQSAKAGVPVPKLYAVGTFDSADRQIYYSIQQKLVGNTFDNMLYVEHISQERARTITEQAGELLARIHSVETEGYGRIDQDGKGVYQTEKDHFGHRTDKKEIYEKIFAELGLDQELFDRVSAELDKADTIFESPHLIHHDYGPKHLFIDENDKITGVIDFEDVMSGDPTVDFSNWQFWFEKETPLEWLLAGYQRIRSLGANYEERFKVAQLYRMVSLMNYYVNKAPFPKWAQAGANRIKEIMK